MPGVCDAGSALPSAVNSRERHQHERRVLPRAIFSKRHLNSASRLIVIRLSRAHFKLEEICLPNAVLGIYSHPSIVRSFKNRL